MKKESSIENAAVKKLESTWEDLVCLKIYRRGWPDRLILGRSINKPFFLEFKDPSEELRKIQEYWKIVIEKKLGYEVIKVTSKDQAFAIVKDRIYG